MNKAQKDMLGIGGLALYALATLNLTLSKDEKQQKIGTGMAIVGAISLMIFGFMRAGEEKSNADGCNCQNESGSSSRVFRTKNIRTTVR